jgi:hypothetical protein
MWVAHPQTEKPLHDSAVVCVKFDPLSSIVVASASTDGQVIVTSNHFPELDGESGTGPFGAIRELDVIFKFRCSEWVNMLSFSASGNTLAFASKLTL